MLRKNSNNVGKRLKNTRPVMLTHTQTDRYTHQHAYRHRDSASSTSANQSPVSPLDNIFALPTEVFSMASPSSQQLWSAGFFCGRACDMKLVTRQSERSGHQQRLLQAFTEDVFIYSLLVYIAH